MKTNAQQLVSHETVLWQPEIDGQRREVPIDVLIHKDALDSDRTQLHYYAEAGASVASVAETVKYLGYLGLPAVGVPLEFLRRPVAAANLKRTLTEAPVALADIYNKRAGTMDFESTDLIGHGEGGGIALFASGRTPGAFDAVAVWDPHKIPGTLFETDDLEELVRLPDVAVFGSYATEQTQLVRYRRAFRRVGAGDLVHRLPATVNGTNPSESSLAHIAEWMLTVRARREGEAA